VVAYRADEMVPSSDFAKKFGSFLTQIREKSVDKLAILKNNKVEAILISRDDYEAMSEALKNQESKELLNSIQSGLKDLKTSKTYPIDKLWDELDEEQKEILKKHIKSDK
jgi:PHD/YefM family antitoxin component YafN of YafNO toxin-antitoxin module